MLGKIRPGVRGTLNAHDAAIQSTHQSRARSLTQQQQKERIWRPSRSHPMPSPNAQEFDRPTRRVRYGYGACRQSCQSRVLIVQVHVGGHTHGQLPERARRPGAAAARRQGIGHVGPSWAQNHREPHGLP